MTSRSLIGTELDQIPVNAMLGGLAYQSSENATIKNLDLRNIAEINAETVDTAVDVFVYDTSKDSDGGAWRQRTQHTSWYGESLNTPTRGSRREFPAVAVIVATTTKVTIYDGDDPDLPMWMVFHSDGGNCMIRNSGNINAVTMLNAELCVGRVTGSKGLGQISFITEVGKTIRRNGPGYLYIYKGNIEQRNDSLEYINTSDITQQITGDYVYDVAMTVLPNAPIDETTGLAVPTIAAATDGGVSVIKDDGTIISTSGSSHIHKVEFTDDHGLNAIISNTGNGNWACVYVNDFEKINGLNYGTYNNWDGVVYRTKYDPKALTYKTANVNDTISGFIDLEDRSSAISVPATGGGLTLFEKSPKNSFDPDAGMVAFVTSDYNTGYMHGDIKGAFLSDTTAESFSATNLVSEDFSANWTGATNGVLSVSSGQLTITNSGGSNGRAQSNTFATTSGKKYAFIVKTVSNSSATYRLEVRGPELVATGTTDGQTLMIYFNGTGNSSTFVELYAIGGSGASATYEDAYVVELEEDRSVNDNGLQVFGTITKSAVATGADLVAYGPFTSGNYLQQPYNSDLDFENGDFNITFWYKTADGSTQCILHRGDGDSGGWGSRPIIQIEFNGTNLAAFLAESAFTSFDTLGIPVATAANGKWNQYVLTRSNGMMNVYHNGSLYASTPSMRSLTNVAAKTWIGERPYQTRAADHTSLALFRIGSTAPSAEQIKKIYEDEKVLFQENAACTLYGSSDAVTALAYDDSTSLLHAGTSSGRSDFTGLKRINHDTSAVSTAISAQDGLIAQQ